MNRYLYKNTKSRFLIVTDIWLDCFFFLSGPNCAKFCLSKGQTVCFKIYLHLQLVDPKGYPFMMEIPWLGKKPRVLEELSA